MRALWIGSERLNARAIKLLHSSLPPSHYDMVYIRYIIKHIDKHGVLKTNYKLQT